MDNMNPPFVIYYCLFHSLMAAGANTSPNMGPPGNLGKNPRFEFCRFAEVHGILLALSRFITRYV